MASLDKHPKSGAWVVVWRINGKKQKKYLGKGLTKSQLKNEKADAEKLEADAKRGKGLMTEASRKPKMTFAQFAPLYLAWRKTEMPDSYETVSIHINAAIDVFGHLMIADDEVTEDRWNNVFNDWVEERSKEVAANTIWGEWKDIKACLYRAARTGGQKEGKRWNLCNTSPVVNRVLGGNGESDSDEKIAFKPEQLNDIYKADPERAAVWRFIANTGLRRSELCVLPLDNVELGDKARVRVVHDPDAGLKVKGKKRKSKSRSIPLNAEAKAARDEILANHDGGELFLPKMHPRTWTKQFAEVLRVAKVDRGTLHSLRHTFISRAANNGAAIHLVRLWAGHTTLETTLKYLHTNESYEWIEMDKMLATEVANEKVVALDAYRKAS